MKGSIGGGGGGIIGKVMTRSARRHALPGNGKACHGASVNWLSTANKSGPGHTHVSCSGALARAHVTVMSLKATHCCYGRPSEGDLYAVCTPHQMGSSASDLCLGQTHCLTGAPEHAYRWFVPARVDEWPPEQPWPGKRPSPRP